MKEFRERKRKRALTRSGIQGYLDRAGGFYLQRYDTSEDNFRRILHRKAVRRGIPDDVEHDEISERVEAVVAKYVGLGALNDFEYALRKARGLHARGKARSRIKGWLRQRGVSADVAVAALDRVAEGHRDMDMRAAIMVARRRRIGPFRRPVDDEPKRPKRDEAMRRKRELAILARSGFSFSIARVVIDADTEGALNAAMDGADMR